MAVFVPHGTNDVVGGRRSFGRLHAFGREWGEYIGATDFWLSGASYGQLGSAGNTPVLADAGWTTTSMTQTVGSGADFASKSDIGIPNDTVTNAASDLVKSPAIFGDFMHMEAAAQFLGYFPKFLMLEAYLSFTTASNNETITAFGFVEDGGSPITAADHLAMMYSDGTNFGLRSGADSDAGAAVQTTPLGLRIRIAPGTTDKIQWYLRTAMTAGFASQGTIDLQNDEAPFLFGYGQGAASSNVIGLHWVHIWYSEAGEFD